MEPTIWERIATNLTHSTIRKHSHWSVDERGYERYVHTGWFHQFLTGLPGT